MADEAVATTAGTPDAGTADGAATAGSTSSATEATTNDETTTAENDLPESVKAILAKERQSRRDAEKARKATEKELAELRQASMSEAEKAIEQAKAEARREALADAGNRLVKAELRAAAAGKLGDEQVAALLELDLSRFITDDGEPDSDAIAKFVARFAPDPTENGRATRTVDLGQGRRSEGATAPGINDLLHAAVRGRA